MVNNKFETNFHQVIPKILAVDDNELNLKLVEQILRTKNFQILRASNGEEAIAKYLKEQPDVILLDIRMPGMSGFDVCKKIRNDLKDSLTPIIFVTVENDERIIIECFEVGGNDYIAKPFNYKELIARIENMIRIVYNERKLAAQAQTLRINLENKKKELKLAAKVQHAINDAIIPVNPHIAFRAFYMPTEETGGDFFTLKEIGDYIVFLMGDVSGHGAGSAMIAVITKALGDQLLTKKSAISPNEFLISLNDEFSKYDFEFFTTIFVGVINKKTLELQYTTAGHPIPLLTRKGERKDVFTPEISGFPLGIYPSDYKDFIAPKIARVKLEYQDRLILYSDGLIENLKERSMQDIIINEYLLNKNYNFYDAISLYSQNKTKYNLTEDIDDVAFILIEILKPLTFDKEIRLMEDMDSTIEQITSEIYKYHYSRDDLLNITMILEESLANAIEHGNLNDPDKKAVIRVDVDSEKVFIAIKDEGVGFNPFKLDDPTTEDKIKRLETIHSLEDESYTRGRGIYIIQNIAKEVEWNEEGTEIRITYYNSSPQTIFHHTDEIIKGNP